MGGNHGELGGRGEAPTEGVRQDQGAVGKAGETQHHGVPWPWSQQKLIKSRYFDLHHLTTQLPKVPVSSLEYSKATGQDKVLST